jgi:hypothetical protein
LLGAEAILWNEPDLDAGQEFMEIAACAETNALPGVKSWLPQISAAAVETIRTLLTTPTPQQVGRTFDPMWGASRMAIFTRF